MTASRTYPYDPDTVSPPGDTLLEVLAVRAGVPDDLAMRVIVECEPISADDARQLYQATGIPTDYWLRHDELFREALASGKRSTREFKGPD